MIDSEIRELKKEISSIDQQIDQSKTSFLEEKSFTQENRPFVQKHITLKEGQLKMDVEIEKFKRAYDDLLG